ncbi:MAG: YHYH protein, partial [Flavobacteriales bacterium]|nr:YHYH protein [Flavobacteriales bacterium]
HVNNVSRYHYHNVPIDYFTNDLGISGTDHSPLLGYAADGFPIYYKYLYTNPMNSMGGISEFQSDYQLKSGTRPGDGITAPDGIYDGTYFQDYEQIPAQSELDECGGRYGVTPEYPDGIYYYVLTDNWPYIPRCLKGNFIDNTFKIGPNCPPSASATDCATSSIMNTQGAMYGNALNISIDSTSSLLNLNIAENLVDKVIGIVIYLPSGQIVFSSKAYQEHIQTAHLSEGIYYVQVNMGQDQVTKKFIIQ